MNLTQTLIRVIVPPTVKPDTIDAEPHPGFDITKRPERVDGINAKPDPDFDQSNRPVKGGAIDAEPDPDFVKRTPFSSSDTKQRDLDEERLKLIMNKRKKWSEGAAKVYDPFDVSNSDAAPKITPAAGKGAGSILPDQLG